MKDTNYMADTRIEGRMIFQQTSNADNQGMDSIHLALAERGGLFIYSNKPLSSITDSECLWITTQVLTSHDDPANQQNRST